MRNCKWKILIKLKKENYISDLGVFSLSLTKLLLWLCVCIVCVWVEEEGSERREGKGGGLETQQKFKTQQICMEGAKACHLLSAVPPPAGLICMCMAQRTIAELRACQLQRSAQSVYCLACRCLHSHAAPSAASCRWGSGRGRAWEELRG